MNTKEVKKALGSKGRRLAGEHFNRECQKQGHPFGAAFTAIVDSAVKEALFQIGGCVRMEPNALVTNSNTADSVAAWIDRD
jgi:hypothetical protein